MRVENSSMLIWWPKVKGLGIPMPATKFIIVPGGREELLLEWTYAVMGEGGEVPTGAWAAWFPQVQAAADSMGYPLFMRTDLFSGKHSWNRTCYVPDAASVEGHLGNIVYEGELCDVFGMQHRAVVLREYLLLDPPFRAFDGMPVARERRYFVREGRVQCHHPYWIPDAMRWYRNTPKPPDWERTLRALNEERVDEVRLLTKHAEKVAAVMDGYWSVDFACDHDGTWWLIDMAEGDRSWHPDCAAAEPRPAS